MRCCQRLPASGFELAGCRQAWQSDVDIVVRLEERLRERIDDLKRLPVRVDDGGLLTLGQVVQFRVVEQVASISREFSQRRAAIMINLRGRDVGKLRPGNSTQGVRREKPTYPTATPSSSAASSRISTRPEPASPLLCPWRSDSSLCSS